MSEWIELIKEAKDARVTKEELIDLFNSVENNDSQWRTVEENCKLGS